MSETNDGCRELTCPQHGPANRALAPMQPATIEAAWPLGDQDGYAIRLCTCPDGAYLGARRAGTPCRCERCGFITLDQWNYITQTLAERTAEAMRDAIADRRHLP